MIHRGNLDRAISQQKVFFLPSGDANVVCAARSNASPPDQCLNVQPLCSHIPTTQQCTGVACCRLQLRCNSVPHGKHPYQGRTVDVRTVHARVLLRAPQDVPMLASLLYHVRRACLDDTFPMLHMEVNGISTYSGCLWLPPAEVPVPLLN